MIVKIMFFAQSKDIVGAPQIDLVLADDANVGELKQTLAEQHPGLLLILEQSTISVDKEYAADDRKLYHGAEVAVIPPVGGG